MAQASKQPSPERKAAQSQRSKTRAATIKKHAAARGKSCSVEGCKRPYRAKGYCVTHYDKWRRAEDGLKKQRYKICSKEDCKKPMVRWGLCEEHYQAAAKKGEAAA